MNMMGKRAMAIVFAMALATVAFAGFIFVDADDHLPADLTVTVTDNYGAADDMMTYVGDDVYFEIAPMGLINSTTDYTVVFILNENAPVPMLYDDINDKFNYTLMDVPVGVHDWNISVMNDTDMDERFLTGMLTVYDMPSYTGTGAANIDEDKTVMWDLRADFGPDGTTVVLSNETEIEALGWVIEADPVNATVWNITPPMDWAGDQEFHFTATHSYGEMIEQMVVVTVDPVNDAPIINAVNFDGMAYEPEWVDVMALLNVTGDDDGNFTWLVELMIEEDQMGVNFTVNATDMENDHANLTYMATEVTDGIEVEFDANYHQQNVTIEADASGYYLVDFTVTDSDPTDPMVGSVWILFNVSAVNDAPTIMFDDIDMGDQLDVLTMEEINVPISYADVDTDMDNLTVIWYINDVEVADWAMDYFLYNWSTAGLYNVSVWVTDGEDPSEKIYFWVNVSDPPIEWTAEDVAIDYTEGEDDVVAADAEGLLTYTFSNGRQAMDWDGIDITAMATEIVDDDLIITVSFKGTPYPEVTLDDMMDGDYIDPMYKVYFVAGDFTEAAFDLSAPDMDFAPATSYFDLSYPVGLFDFGYEAEISGNDIVFTVPLTTLSDNDVPTDDFNLFATATLIEAKINNIIDATTKAGYDSAGLAAAAHISAPVDDDDDDTDDDDDDDDDDGFPVGLVIIIVVVLLVIIVVIVIIVMKGKKGDEDELEAGMPEEPAEMPMEEGMEQPMEEQPPMEGMEQPVPEQPPMEQPVPEQPPMEQPVPEQPPMEQPVPEQPVPEQPPMEQPVPPAPEAAPPEPPAQPEAPAPPVPPQPEAPAPPMPPEEPQQ